MGWSCTDVAARAEAKLSAQCAKETGSQNAFYDDGKECFYEVNRIEFDDGHIEGNVYTLRGREIGTFSIDGKTGSMRSTSQEFQALALRAGATSTKE